MEDTCIYYSEIGVRNGEEFLQKLKKQYDFDLVAARNTELVKQWLMQSNQVKLLVTEINNKNIDLDLAHVINGNNNSDRQCNEQSGHMQDPYFMPWCDFIERQNENGSSTFRANKLCNFDSVFNVAFIISDLKCTMDNLKRNGVTILKPIHTVKDRHGEVQLAVVKSCIGNVIHTLIEFRGYDGPFLPHFEAVTSRPTAADSCGKLRSVPLSNVDHVAFACKCGQSYEVLDWYEKCFGMKRFLVNSDESVENGFVIDKEDIGLMLKAFEYWKCAESGVVCSSSRKNSMKFVIAEALPGQGPNQIDTFLKEHGGPGIQHIGLNTPDILETVSALKDRGVKFAEPPHTYYTEVGKLGEIVEIGLDVRVLMENGILLDAEADPGLDDEDKLDGNTKRYLMQKFTRPLFSKDTFFLEVIQRVGARGFGSGNITALWRSVQAYMGQTVPA